jgi:uncharacterized small protein (DUF1192 family)
MRHLDSWSRAGNRSGRALRTRPTDRGNQHGHRGRRQAEKKLTHEIGQDLSLLSVEELAERIALLSAEIERLQAAMTKKRASRDAADRFFKT